MAIINRIYKSSTVILATYLCVLVCFYLLAKLLGYTLVPFNIINVVIVVVLTICGIKNRAKRTKIYTVWATWFPLMVILFLAVIGVFWYRHVSSGTKYVHWSEVSPNGTYLVEVGQLGGINYSAPGQFIDITWQNKHINLLIGTLKKDAEQLYKGASESVFLGRNYGEPITILWETEEIFYVDGRETKYVIPAK